MKSIAASRTIRGKKELFKKSSFSTDYSKHCVGVCIKESIVHVLNTKNCTGPMLSFTHEEWDAFIKGVKNDEFDLALPDNKRLSYE